MNWKKLKYEILVSIAIFIVGGLWMPIICGGQIDILHYISAGIFSVIILWGGSVIYYLIKRSSSEMETS
jgi:hypothetical protein